MGDVSVIGAGAMGSALTEVLAASGADVRVWNRTRQKAEALAGPQVRVAGSAAEALASSALAIVAVTDHLVARTLVAEAGEDLEGKAVASTCVVTPEQARDLDAVVSAAGGRYLDLAILANASEVPSGDCVFLLSGDRAAYEAHRDRLESIGRISYVDGAPGAAYISGMAVVVAYLPMAVALLQGLRICERHDIPLDWFKPTVLEFYPFQIRSLLERIAAKPNPSAADVEGSVDVMADWAAENAAYLREMDLDTGMFDALHRLFSAASDAGHGDAAWTRIAEHVASN
jgi:3-hydroxyisobutyrate dehydrogenase-like beta-hydroxyacid dehydrogenase